MHVISILVASVVLWHWYSAICHWKLQIYVLLIMLLGLCSIVPPPGCYSQWHRGAAHPCIRQGSLGYSCACPACSWKSCNWFCSTDSGMCSNTLPGQSGFPQVLVVVYVAGSWKTCSFSPYFSSFSCPLPAVETLGSAQGFLLRTISRSQSCSNVVQVAIS